MIVVFIGFFIYLLLIALYLLTWYFILKIRLRLWISRSVFKFHRVLRKHNVREDLIKDLLNLYRDNLNSIFSSLSIRKLFRSIIFRH